MNLQQAIEEGMILIVPPNKARAKNLFRTAQDSFDTISELSVSEKSAKTITRDLYECLRQYAQAKGYERGYSFQNHAAIKHFLGEVLGLSSIAKKFDRFRKIRNGINYYGDSVSVETAKDALETIPQMMTQIKSK
ncbi:MAG: hypothetical protein ACQESF_07190 [Nanobdellota archaeon]